MKKLITLSFVLIGISGIAQTSNRTTAIMSFDKYAPCARSLMQEVMQASNEQEQQRLIENSKCMGHLNIAKEKIDLAAAHEKTMNDPKTLGYKAMIDYEFLAPGMPKMGNVSRENIIETFKKAKEMDPKNRYVDSYTRSFMQKRQMFIAQGAQMFEEKNFEASLMLFKESAFLTDVLGDKMGETYFNTALAAENLKKMDVAGEYYKKSLDVGYEVDYSRTKYINSLNDAGKKEEALAFIKAERAKDPTNVNLIIDELNIYLLDQEFEKASALLDEAIKNTTDQATLIALYSNAGVVYDNLGQYDKAKAMYEEALKLDPENFELNVGMGFMLFNQAAEMINKANDIDDINKYNIAKKAAEDKFRESLPYLEKSRSINPKDPQTIQSLMQIYGRLGMTDEFNEVEKVYNELISN